MTNAAAIGYAIMAAKYLELDERTIKQLERLMYEFMDECTEAEAEEVYRNH